MKYPPFEWKHLEPRPIVGVDEVGRGCLAGPVYAGAVILNLDNPFDHYTDSKLISENRREQLAEEILKNHQCGIGFATVEEIDQINILQAALLAMNRAVKNLGICSGHLLIDGNMKIPNLLGFEQTTVIKGDQRVKAISAASIVAKVTRDRLLRKLAEEFPQYGFERHKGYSTAEHKEAISIYGPTSYHRKTFAGVREHLAKNKV